LGLWRLVYSSPVICSFWKVLCDLWVSFWVFSAVHCLCALTISIATCTLLVIPSSDFVTSDVVFYFSTVSFEPFLHSSNLCLILWTYGM
jgi:hypothetical protein